MSDRPAASGDVASGNATAGRGWRIACLALAIVGVCLSADLMRLHVNVHTDPDYQSYCAVSEGVNCETVAASDHAVMLGLPLAVWGLWFFAGVGGMAAWGLRRRGDRPVTWPFGLLFWASLGASAYGVVLFYVSKVVIGSLCLLCLASYGVSFALLFASAMALRRGAQGPLSALRAELAAVRQSPGAPLAYVGAFLLAWAALFVGLPRYWQVDTPVAVGAGRGFTDAGHAWIGAEEPAIEIVEFSDYQCPHCQRGHQQMRELVAGNPDRVRLVHRHFPLDQTCNDDITRPFHPHACLYSALAHCAGEQGRFWQANDFLYERGRRPEAVTAEELAAGVGVDAGRLAECVDDPGTRRRIARDLEAGRALRVRGTPTFVLDGRVYPGRIPPEVLEAKLAGAPSGRSLVPARHDQP